MLTAAMVEITFDNSDHRIPVRMPRGRKTRVLSLILSYSLSLSLSLSLSPR